MNRRSFFKTALLALAASQVPPLPRVGKTAVRLNPEWVNAPYEVQLWISNDLKTLTPVVWKRFQAGPPPRISLAGMRRVEEAYPLRFSEGRKFVLPVDTGS